jgi:hypothetical protein
LGALTGFAHEDLLALMVLPVSVLHRAGLPAFKAPELPFAHGEQGLGMSHEYLLEKGPFAKKQAAGKTR